MRLARLRDPKTEFEDFIWTFFGLFFTFSYVLTLRAITWMIYRVISEAIIRDICLGMFGDLLGDLGAFLRIS